LLGKLVLFSLNFARNQTFWSP